MFDLKRPCADCPFRVDKSALFRLDEARLREIWAAPAFQCHKTLAHGAEKERPQQCAGRMILGVKTGEWNQMMQVAHRLGAVDIAALGDDTEAAALVHDDLDTLIDGHRGG